MNATLLTAVLLAATSGLAVPPSGETVPTSPSWVNCSTVTADAACDHLSRAEFLLKENRRKEAKRELQAALRVRRSNGQYAGEELWQLANFEYQEGRTRAVARLVDELAKEAGRVGDLSRQAIALLEAAAAYDRLRMQPQAAARLSALMPLLDSPYLPDVTREHVRNRLI